MLFWPGGDEDISPNGDNKRTLVDSVADWLNRNDVTVRPFGREILIFLLGCLKFKTSRSVSLKTQPYTTWLL